MAQRKPLKPCNKHGCRNLTNGRYCKEHQDIAKEKERQRNRHYDKHKRDKDSAAFYKNKAWELVRLQALMRDSNLCQHCLRDKQITHADMVDHVIPIRVDLTLRLVLDNLQALCNRCHSVKTAEDKRKYGDKL